MHDLRDEIPAGHVGRVWHTRNIEEHVGLIGRQVRVSVLDPRVPVLATQVVSGHRTVAFRDHGRQYAFTNPHADACGTADVECEIDRVFHFIKKNVRYQEDPPDVDKFSAAIPTLVAGGGDCDDHVVLHCALLYSLGYRVGCEVTSTDGQSWKHVYAIVQVPKRAGVKTRWLPLDTAAPEFVADARPGWRYPDGTHYKQFEFRLT